MSIYLKRLALRPGLAAGLLATVVGTGCPWLPQGGSGILTLPSGPSAAAPPASKGAGAAAASSAGRAGLLGGEWSQTVRAAEQGSTAPAFRWKHAGVDELASGSAAAQVDLYGFLDDKNPVVAANASIALARRGDVRGAQVLAAAVRNKSLKLPMRRAAVEAMAMLPGPQAVDLLRDVADRYGRASGDGAAAYSPELHTEVIFGLVRHVDPSEDPRFAEALRSRSAEVRREAIRAFASARGGELPGQVVKLAADGNPQVRAAALEALARRRHPEALKHLTDALHDFDLGVRVAAIGALGEIGGPQARTALEQMQKEQTEAIRAAAVASLAKLGSREDVVRAADDRSWRVRLVVAETAAAYADRDGAALVGRLLNDSSTEVQLRALAAVAQWPLEQSGPILLAAMGRTGYLLRKRAAEQLAAQWAPAEEFPVDGPAERRREVLEGLQGRFHREFVTPRVAAALQQKPVIGVGGTTPAAPSDDSAGSGPWSPLLDRLTAKDVSERRWAADELAKLAAKQAPGASDVARLAQIATAESDQLVWRSVFQAVAGDASEPSMRMAYAAISHPVLEVRRRACEHLAAHPRAEHARVLVPTLQDPSHVVVCAAIRALGAAGASDSAGPLRRMLAATNEEVRLEAAVALVRLGDQSGPPALERLSYSQDSHIRVRTAQAMGEMPAPSYVPALVRLLDDRGDVRHAALTSLPKVAGRDVAAQDPPPANAAERARMWKRWYESQGR